MSTVGSCSSPANYSFRHQLASCQDLLREKQSQLDQLTADSVRLQKEIDFLLSLRFDILSVSSESGGLDIPYAQPVTTASLPDSASYVWASSSKVFHLPECHVVKNSIAANNRIVGDIPPPRRTLCSHCRKLKK